MQNIVWIFASEKAITKLNGVLIGKLPDNQFSHFRSLFNLLIFVWNEFFPLWLNSCGYSFFSFELKTSCGLCERIEHLRINDKLGISSMLLMLVYVYIYSHFISLFIITSIIFLVINIFIVFYSRIVIYMHVHVCSFIFVLRRLGKVCFKNNFLQNFNQELKVSFLINCRCSPEHNSYCSVKIQTYQVTWRIKKYQQKNSVFKRTKKLKKRIMYKIVKLELTPVLPPHRSLRFLHLLRRCRSLVLVSSCLLHVALCWTWENLRKNGTW